MEKETPNWQAILFSIGLTGFACGIAVLVWMALFL